MTGLAITFLSINVIALLWLPRRWAAFPLLAGVCYMTRGQGIEVGALSFPIIRLIILAGFVRVVLRGERPVGAMNGMDWLMLAWSASAVISSMFHKDISAALILRLGIVYNNLGVYLIIRTLCQTQDDVVTLCWMIAVILVPVALEMIFERMTSNNLFSKLGGVSEIPSIRYDGSIRAQGPFAHSILAGTVGAVCLPLVILLWRRYRKVAAIGIFACIVMIYTSNSSGPIMSAFAAIGALLMWRFRYNLRLLCWLAVIGYIALGLVMLDPPYYIIARIDLTGGSTGWHRARLIESSIEHLSEWWIGGTDYTRHWMPSGVSWSADHTDITNYYLKMGVWGGLPLMLLFIACLVKGFSYVVQLALQMPDSASNLRFMFWSMGASLFSHATTCIGVSYFDQSFLFLYLTLAAISSSWSAKSLLALPTKRLAK